MQVGVKGPVAADSAHMLLKLAIGGMGIIRFGDNVVARTVQEGELEVILQDFRSQTAFP